MVSPLLAKPNINITYAHITKDSKTQTHEFLMEYSP